ncbi:MAG: 30S ribosomal protein S6 [Alphaproteobacteria bacterium]|nr:30S ribosomal protein S6 [Alphaproteobacteria bacterium]
MALYENVFIARQDLTSSQVEGLIERFTAIITQQGGQVKKKEYWGLRNLAYPINKNKKGHYVLFNLDAPATAIVEMERNMGLSEDLLRHLTIRVDVLENEPSAMMQNRNRDYVRDGASRGKADVENSTDEVGDN